VTTALTIAAVGRLFGKDLPLSPPGKCKCPFRQHHRQDKTFRLFAGSTGDVLWRCWSCDEPDNKGDAIKLYQILSGCDRKEAWKRLREDGFAVPGLNEDGKRARPSYDRTQRKPAGPGIVAVARGPVLPLDQAELERWRSADTGAIAAFAKKRGIGEDVLRDHGIVEVQPGHVGFVYVDPATNVPCRVKVRGVVEKRFWIEPRPDPSKPGARALAPLYLAHRLRPTDAQVKTAVITEGEADALALISAGIPNVVSLPDGSDSAKTVDLRPLWRRFTLWLVATDGDAPGNAAAQVLRERAMVTRCTDVVRVQWKRVVEDEGGGGVVEYKDANDALRDGFTREDFVQCFRVATRDRFGYVPEAGW
jgi:hypothetical protein